MPPQLKLQTGFAEVLSCEAEYLIEAIESFSVIFICTFMQGEACFFSDGKFRR